MPPLRSKNFCAMLCLAMAAHLAHAGNANASKMQPSDCRARDADSTCATAVAGATVPQQPLNVSDKVLYDGPLGGVPAAGYAYWGFDFAANQSGLPSPVRADEFINRSNGPVTITLSFTFPVTGSCNHDCLPGVEFRVGTSWIHVDPAYVINGDTVSLTHEFESGQGFGWVIGLWSSTNPRLTVTIPKGSTATLADVGMPALPNLANVMPASTHLCICGDQTTATCSDGTYFSNGLLGAWSQQTGNYERAQAFTDCQGGN